LRRLARRLALGAAVAICTTATSIAEPFDSDSAAAARDPDYIAGRQATDKKDWSEVIRRFSAAVSRDERNADLHNYLGYAYRQNRQLDSRFRNGRHIRQQGRTLRTRERQSLQFAGVNVGVACRNRPCF
jgi:hypothetical protein